MMENKLSASEERGSLLPILSGLVRRVEQTQEAKERQQSTDAPERRRQEPEY